MSHEFNIKIEQHISTHERDLEEEAWQIQRNAGEVRQEDATMVAPPEAEEPTTAAAKKDEAETQRESRRLLAATTSTPGWLLQMFPLGDDVCLVHVQHRNSQLPHFQARFADGSKHAGKILANSSSQLFFVM